MRGQSKQDGNSKSDDIVWTNYFGALVIVGECRPSRPAR